MMNDKDIKKEQALILLDRAYKMQLRGNFDEAVSLYKRSLSIEPTAEAYTSLAWTYGVVGNYDKAIELCHKAIALDPLYGNPYNDIGSYLIALEKWEESAIWFEQALKAPRYAIPQQALLNLGRVYEHLGDYHSALIYYNRAHENAPLHLPASWAKYALLGKLN